jgi:hypothetical protein
MSVLFENLEDFVLHALGLESTEEEIRPFCLSTIMLDDQQITLEEGVNFVLDMLTSSNMEQVLRFRFGLYAEGRKMKRSEIASELGDKTENRIRALEMRAMDRIRIHPIRKSLLAKFLRYPVINGWGREPQEISYDQILNLKALAQAARVATTGPEITLSASVFGFIEQANSPLPELVALVDSGAKVKTVGPKTRIEITNLLQTAQKLRNTM